VVEGSGPGAGDGGGGTQLLVDGSPAQLQQLVMEGGSGQLQLLSAGQEIYQILTPEGNIQVGLL
jgi:hypothetical protein